MYARSLAGVEGPWVLVHAELNVEHGRTGRGAFGLFNTVAVAPSDNEALLSLWSKSSHPGRDLIDLPRAYYLFAGEIPWHPRMVTSGDDIAGTGARPISRDEEDGWVDPHDTEDPYIDYVRVDMPVDHSSEGGTGLHDNNLPQSNVGREATPAEEFDYLALVEATIAAHRAAASSYVEVELESLAHVYSWEGHNSSENEAFAYVPSQRLSARSGLRSVPGGFDQVDADGRRAAMSFAAPKGFTGHVLYVREDILKVYAGTRSVITFGWGEREVHAAWPEQIPNRLLKAYRNHSNVWRAHRVVADGEQHPTGAESGS